MLPVARQGSATVHTKNQSQPPPGGDQVIERRGQPRTDGAATDWETIVLKRVERHVEALSSEPAKPADTTGEAGWEQTALRALQRRLRDLKEV